MLISIVSFLLESVFFVLIAASLLRAWMNWLRINMRVQPGIFIMAITDWLVKTLRRVMPATLAKSKVDWGSVLAAFVFAVVYGVLLAALVGVSTGSSGLLEDVAPSSIVSILGFAFKTLIGVLLRGLFFMVLAFAVLSWVQPGSPIYHQLGRLIDPLITPLRRLIPSIGGVDLSALVLMLILQVGLMVLG